MNAWIVLYIYVAGAALVALRLAWCIRYRLDKYDRRYSNVSATFLFNSILWPLLLLKPGNLIHPNFSPNWLNEGRADAERELDRLEQHLPPCGTSIRYAPNRDESGDCDSEFVFDVAEVETIIAKRLAELPPEQHGRYTTILEWLRQRNPSSTEPTGVPVAWNGHFLNVAVGMMNRGLGRVRCGECGKIITQAEISLHSNGAAGWSYTVWRCPQNHKLLTRDAFHCYIRKAA